MNWVVAVIGSVAALVTIAYFVLTRHHPENAASHQEPVRSGSAMPDGDTDDRPARPGAEADGVAGRGQIVPGPARRN